MLLPCQEAWSIMQAALQLLEDATVYCAVRLNVSPEVLLWKATIEHVLATAEVSTVLMSCLNRRRECGHTVIVSLASKPVAHSGTKIVRISAH